MDRFLLAENPMQDPDNRRVFILHTIYPEALIEVHHEAISGHQMCFTANYRNPDGVIETITLEIVKWDNSSFDQEVMQKVLSKAWRWYRSYLEWEDANLNEDEEANLN